MSLTVSPGTRMVSLCFSPRRNLRRRSRTETFLMATTPPVCGLRDTLIRRVCCMLSPPREGCVVFASRPVATGGVQKGRFFRISFNFFQRAADGGIHCWICHRSWLHSHVFNGLSTILHGKTIMNLNRTTEIKNSTNQQFKKCKSRIVFREIFSK